MQERIVEILIFVLSEIQKTNKPLGEIDVTELKKQGYTEVEISAAFRWLVERTHTESPTWTALSKQPRDSFRILHAGEQVVVPPEAFGYLIQLRELNIISEQEMEIILERCMMSGFERLSVQELQTIVVSLLFDSEISEAHHGRTVVISNDTIH